MYTINKGKKAIVDGVEVPISVNVTINNLRHTVEVLSNAETPVHIRDSFYATNSIPGLIWIGHSGNPVLANSDDIMPQDFDEQNVRDNFTELKIMVDLFRKKKPESVSDSVIDMDSCGCPSLLMSNYCVRQAINNRVLAFNEQSQTSAPLPAYQFVMCLDKTDENRTKTHTSLGYLPTYRGIPLSSQSSSASGDAPPATRRRSQKSLTFASPSAEESERDEKGIIDWNKIREVKVKNYVPEQKGLGALQTMAATELDGEMDEQDDIQSEQAVSRDLEITMRAREDEYIKSVILGDELVETFQCASHSCRMDGINKWTKKMYEAECTGGRNTIHGNESSTSEAKQPRLVDEADKTDNNIRERDGNGIEVQWKKNYMEGKLKIQH
ncbi:unnamed protein product [Parnassius apollo]|uniref:(apollo) hypothetical protein n=1 Tax=Parnassius apollo TaxID=110799 RepID=A0A8S3W2B9_PARAO|nr:unnamed protein product [Parnassius apollo]